MRSYEMVKQMNDFEWETRRSAVTGPVVDGKFTFSQETFLLFVPVQLGVQ
jgi:hypothetical protein